MTQEAALTDQDSDKSTIPTWVWQRLSATIALSAVGVAVTWSAWADIVDIALQDEEASHIWLAPILVGWLIAVRLDQLAGYRPRLDPIGPIMILIGWAVSFFGFYNQVQSFWHGGALLLVVGCFITVMGAGLLWRMPAVFVAMLFLLPVPGMARQQIAIPLQTATASITQAFFDLLAVPVQRSGNLLSYQGVDVTIAEACNGMRMVFTLLSVCYVFAFGSNLRASVRGLVLVISPLIAVACNVIRVIPTIWVYGHYSTQVAETFHDLSGWVMIFVSFMLLMGMVRLLEWLQIPIRPRKQEKPSVTKHRGVWPGQKWVAGALAVLAIGSASVEAAMRPSPLDAQPYHQHVAELASTMPPSFGDWEGRAVEVPTAAVQLLKPNAIISRSFHNKVTGEDVTLLIVQCRDARDMAGHYPPQCYPGVGYVTDSALEDQWPVRDRMYPGMTYRFTRGVMGQQQKMVVCNLLLMPDGRFVRDMKAVYRAAADYATHFFGAAQIQLVTAETLAPQRRDEIVSEFLEQYRPLIEAISGSDQAMKPEEKE
ncbi:MAG: exosortase/archaeosortase family protein [Phycisphaeraceae bacterium]|nr:exosortase/archaeosortase family protein [Phycisphaeraceae bacterium]